MANIYSDNDIIEQLRTSNEDVPTPLRLPDEDELVEIDEQLLLGLPFEFREFLLEVSDVVYGAIEPVTVADPQSHTYLPEVAAYAWSIGLPRELIPICRHGEDYYCVHQEGNVVIWRNGELLEDEWESIWHWAEEIWLKKGH